MKPYLGPIKWIWERLPFRYMTLLVILLMVVKEHFPFSNFPMYSNFDNEADVIFVTDQKDQPVPMSKVFRTGSAATKKVYKSELSDLCRPQGRDTEQSLLAERQAAGVVVLKQLKGKIKPGILAPDVDALRLYRRTFRLEDGVFREPPFEQLAEVKLP